LLARIAMRRANQLLIRDAIVSGLNGWELQFLQTLLTDPQWQEQKPGRTVMLQSLASAVMREKQPAKIELLLMLAAGQDADELWRQRGLLAGIAELANGRIRRTIPFNAEPGSLRTLANSDDAQTRERIEQIKPLFSWPGHQSESASAAADAPTRDLTAPEETLIAEGKVLYLQICAGCHGLNGEGLRPVAPPLANSEWVTESVERLIRITLHGVTGAINVDGTTYQPPIILPEMPPLTVLDDIALASVLSYVRSDWGHNALPVSPKQVETVRGETSSRATPWTEIELLQIK
jgi:mono/diheme cytochrome c family protein